MDSPVPGALQPAEPAPAFDRLTQAEGRALDAQLTAQDSGAGSGLFGVDFLWVLLARKPLP